MLQNFPKLNDRLSGKGWGNLSAVTSCPPPLKLDEGGSVTARIEHQQPLWVSGEGPAGGYAMFGGPQVVITTNGTVLSLMEGRKHNSTIDLVDDGGWHDVLLKRSFTSGESWSPMQIVHSESNSTLTPIRTPTLTPLPLLLPFYLPTQLQL